MSQPPSDLTFAPLTASDSRADQETVADLLASQLLEHDIPLARSGPPPSIAHAVAGMLERPERGFILLARTGGAIAGVAYVSFTWTLEKGGASCWLEELHVRPEFRERGVGTALLRAAMQRAATSGRLAMDLEVETGHERAARLYEREGFGAMRRSRYARPLLIP